MRNINPVNDLVQNALFDSSTLDACSWWATDLTDSARRRLEESWPGIFRRSLLKLMPAKELGDNFDPTFGRPTKELYSMAALVFIMEFKNWTLEDAVDAYTFDNSIHFALNLPNRQNYLCTRTLEEYRRHARNDELACETFLQVTRTLVDGLNLDISRQRLDSTHMLSDMALFGRTKLLGVSVKRLLAAIARHCPESYATLPTELRERYETTIGRLFGEASKTKEGRAKSQEQIAQDMHLLIETFANDSTVCERTTYKSLVRLFNEHCEIKGHSIIIRPKSVDAQGQSSQTLQNPSDPSAGYDGHKGSGHKVQLAQTSAKENSVQLITGCLPQSAGDHDANGLDPMLEQLERNKLTPSELAADTHYGSDDNHQLAQSQGIDLISPVPGLPPKDGSTESQQSQQMPRDPSAPPKKHGRRQAPEKLTREQEQGQRNSHRRQRQQTEEWREKYRRRSGIEGLNRGLDRRTGIKHLRVRGEQAIAHSTFGKVMGWNIVQAARAMQMKGIGARKKAKEVRQAAEKAAKRLKTWITPLWSNICLSIRRLMASISRATERENAHQGCPAH